MIDLAMQNKQKAHDQKKAQWVGESNSTDLLCVVNFGDER